MKKTGGLGLKDRVRVSFEGVVQGFRDDPEIQALVRDNETRVQWYFPVRYVETIRPALPTTPGSVVTQGPADFRYALADDGYWIALYKGAPVGYRTSADHLSDAHVLYDAGNGAA